MKVNENVIHRCVVDEDILVPIGEAAGDTNGLYVLTPTGAEIWDMLAEGKGIEDIVSIMSEDYGRILRSSERTLRRSLRSSRLWGLSRRTDSGICPWGKCRP